MSCEPPFNPGTWVPIFPLPNVVLMPRAILPLHVFEKRYRALTRDALCDSRLIAMALLKPGYEPLYDTLEAPIHDVACVGRILREERLPDGRYNFLLQGLCRGRIVDEDRTLEYRRARLTPVAIVDVDPETERVYRAEFLHLFTSGPLRELARQANWLELLRCKDLSFSEVIDLLASVLLPCSEDKQKFLSEPHVAARAKCLCRVMADIATQITPPASPDAAKPRGWPPACCDN